MNIFSVGVLSVLAFFLVTTRGYVWASNWFAIGSASTRHVYWLYRHPVLVWLTDRQFVVSAVLLFQYQKLATMALGLAPKMCRGKTALQVACVSGDLTERLATQFREGRVLVFDLVQAGVHNSREKLARAGKTYHTRFFQGDATKMPVLSESVDYVLAFFLFHELPSIKKIEVFRECLRVLAPQGRFMYVEFNRPESFLLRAFARTIFGLFEPYALEMWDWRPTVLLNRKEYLVERETVFGKYFQVVTVTKLTNDSL